MESVRVGLVIPLSEIKLFLHFMFRCPISFYHLHSLGACHNSDRKIVLLIPLMLGTVGSGPFIKTQNLVKSFAALFF